MPELPEVEIMARNVDRWARGRVVERLTVFDATIFGAGQAPRDDLAGATVVGASRRAKWILVEMSRGVLLLHARMTGKLVRSRRPEHPAPRLVLALDNGEEVSFIDRRRLGTASWFPGSTASQVAGDLEAGPEPYPEPQSGSWWRERLAGARGAVKPALMQQRRVAGIGNILASELCFRARIDPSTPVPALTDAAYDALAAAFVPLVDDVLRTESGDEIDYLNEGGRVEDTVFVVYAREGRPCVTCGHEVARFVQSGRSTFWCPQCQAPSTANRRPLG